MKASLLLCALIIVVPAYAHQPVMDMAPRWSNGYGFQVRYGHFGSDELLQGQDSIDNGSGIDRFVDTTWLEGVYTFHRSIRATIKIPYVDQRRTTQIGGASVRQTTSGIGDIVLGLPLKRYKNQGSMTQNWGITPSIRIPTGRYSGDFPISDGSWDVGLGVSYSRESPKNYQLYDLYYWKQGSGERGMQSGDSWGFDANVGIHPWHDNDTNSGIFLMWDISAHHEEAPNALNLTTASGGDRVQTGPVFVYYRQNFMARAEYKLLAYERVVGTSISRGNEFSLAVGFTF